MSKPTITIDEAYNLMEAGCDNMCFFQCTKGVRQRPECLQKQEQKVGNHEEIRDVTWIRKVAPPPEYFKKLRIDHKHYQLIISLVAGNDKEAADEFNADRAFYHLNPEE